MGKCWSRNISVNTAKHLIVLMTKHFVCIFNRFWVTPVLDKFMKAISRTPKSLLKWIEEEIEMKLCNQKRVKQNTFIQNFQNKHNVLLWSVCSLILKENKNLGFCFGFFFPIVLWSFRVRQVRKHCLISFIETWIFPLPC